MHKVSEFDPVWKTFPMIYVIVGMFFNYYQFMSIVLKKYRQENIFVYSIVLVLTDAMVLVTPLLCDWLKTTVNVDIRAVSNGGCRLHFWLSGMAMDVPPWILVVMAYEKRALLWFPVPADSKFSRNTAKLLMWALGALSACRHQHFLWGTLHNTVVITKHNASISFTTTTTSTTTTTTTTTATTTNNSSITLLSNASTSLPQLRMEKSMYHYHEGGMDIYRPICDVTHDTYGFFLALYSPWIDLLVRGIGPCACLVIYNGKILRKIQREKYCAFRLMRLANITPPDWFFLGVMEMQQAVKWTGSLTLLITINSLPYSFYRVIQPFALGCNHRFQPALWLISNLLFYLNYTLVFPAFAVKDHALLVIMRDTWRLPLARKRGTNTASMAPRITPESDKHRGYTVGAVFHKAFASLNTTSHRPEARRASQKRALPLN